MFDYSLELETSKRRKAELDELLRSYNSSVLFFEDEVHGKPAKLMVQISHVHNALCIVLLRAFLDLKAAFFKMIESALYRVGCNGDMSVRAVERLFHHLYLGCGEYRAVAHLFGKAESRIELVGNSFRLFGVGAVETYVNDFEAEHLIHRLAAELGYTFPVARLQKCGRNYPAASAANDFIVCKV